METRGERWETEMEKVSGKERRKTGRGRQKRRAERERKIDKDGSGEDREDC